MKRTIPADMVIGYLHLWQEKDRGQNRDTSSLLSGTIQSTGDQTIATKQILDETVVVLGKSSIYFADNERYNTFTTADSYYDTEQRRLFAYSDRVLYKP